MATSRADPTRARRGTGTRPAPAKKKSKTLVRKTLEGPQPPAPLPAEVRPLWDAVLADLTGRGLMPSDLEALHAMVMAAHRRRQAAALVDELGLLVIGPTGALMANPAVKIERESTVLCMRIAQDFGLTLASRMRLGLIQLAGESLLQSLTADLDRA
jgi:P27 family predicted phage terminase small subunit